MWLHNVLIYFSWHCCSVCVVRSCDLHFNVICQHVPRSRELLTCVFSQILFNCAGSIWRTTHVTMYALDVSCKRGFKNPSVMFFLFLSNTLNARGPRGPTEGRNQAWYQPVPKTNTNISTCFPSLLFTPWAAQGKRSRFLHDFLSL